LAIFGVHMPIDVDASFFRATLARVVRLREAFEDGDYILFALITEALEEELAAEVAARERVAA
jgi:hypothetical protein